MHVTMYYHPMHLKLCTLLPVNKPLPSSLDRFEKKDKRSMKC